LGSSDITFGWTIEPVPKGFSDEVMADPNRAGEALADANERFIEIARPHFDTVWVEDHFQWGKRATLEAMTTLSYLAGKFDDMRFGHIVLGQSYRNPAYTAKMAANLHLLTKGKFILGIGAGWKEDEYRAYGYPYPPAGERIAQLDEAAQIIKLMWSESPATFHGKYYHIEDAECLPQPDPAIPLLIAGGGEKKTLQVVAKHADWWNHNTCTSEEFAHKQRVLEGHCRDVGRDPAEILHTHFAYVSLVDDPSKVARREGIYVVGGTADMVTRELEEFVRLGVKHFQIRLLDFPKTDGIESFINKVIPRLNG